MLALSFDLARTTLAAEVAEQGVPGAVALVRHRGVTVLHEAVGAAALEPAYRPMELDTIFDLASLTKPLATAPVILMLVELGRIEVDAPVGTYLAEMEGPTWQGLTIRRLLTHSSGLPAWYPTYVNGAGRENVLRTIAGLPLASEPGTKVEYSCLGFIVLGLAAERVTGETLDVLARDWVFAPLGLTTIGFRPQFPAERYALTERGNAHEQGSVRQDGLRFEGWLDGFQPGVVHDGNARYGLAGVAGNAGLFGAAEDVAMLGELWRRGGELSGVRLLSESVVRLGSSDQTTTHDDGRGLGWDINRLPATGVPATPHSCGSLLSPRTYGHTGFTGTSLWIDPANDLEVVLLTNRVHPSVSTAGDIMTVRHRFHDAVVKALTTSP